MVRPSQRLHPARTVVTPRPAATMLLLRDSPAGPEVLMTRRAHQANFAAGAYVFPGGAIDAADHASHALAQHRPQQTGPVLTQAIAAIRESFEELGILLAYRADGAMAQARDVASLDRLPPDGESFASQCAARGLVLAADRLRHLARWIADPNNTKRFDTAFFVARMPEGQVPVADGTEQFEPEWVRPVDALERHKAGSFFMIFPTIRTLQRLCVYDSVESVLAACVGEGPLTHNATRTGLFAGVQTRFTNDEPAYDELLLVSPHGETVHNLDWRHDEPVALLRNVQRLTDAATGANTYRVGDASTGYVVISPEGVVHGTSPDREGRVVLAGPDVQHTLVMVHGAGWLLEEDGLLFATHPAGSSGAGAHAASGVYAIEFILPARGYVRRFTS